MQKQNIQQSVQSLTINQHVEQTKKKQKSVQPNQFSQKLENHFKNQQKDQKPEQQCQKEQNQQAQSGENQQNQQQGQDNQQLINGKWRKIQQPKKTVKLFMVDFDHCDAKKCSGKKLQRFKLLSDIKDKKKKFKGVVLSAFGKKEVSAEDLQYAEKYGVCVIDCSWNRIEETKQFRYKHQRKLPFVTAGNPVNYGKPYQLSCAQALATALCTIGYVEQAEFIMSKFGWADGFWSLNHLISNYADCKTLEQLKKESKKIQEAGNSTFQRNYDLSDPQSSDDEN